MDHGDALEILLRHDAWATRRMLEQCRGMPREQFHRRFDIGPGSLHDTLTHVIGAMRRWHDRIAGNQLRPSLEPPPPGVDRATDARERSVDELLGLLSEAAHDLAAAAADARENNMLDRIVEVRLQPPTPSPRSAQVWRVTVAGALVHVCDHGTHHRAQCLNMLKHIAGGEAAQSLPEIDVVEWQAETMAM